MERTAIIRQLAGQIVRMSQQKFASNVVEKCLTFGSPEERQLLVNEMLGYTEENEPLQVWLTLTIKLVSTRALSLTQNLFSCHVFNFVLVFTYDCVFNRPDIRFTGDIVFMKRLSHEAFGGSNSLISSLVNIKLSGYKQYGFSRISSMVCYHLYLHNLFSHAKMQFEWLNSP